QPTVQATAAILRSQDGGATWAPAWSSAAPQGQAFRSLDQIALSPSFATDHTVFALWADPDQGGVLRSTDGGATFQDVNVGSVRFDPTAKTLSVSPAFATDHTVAVTAQGGTTAASFLSTD